MSTSDGMETRYFLTDHLGSVRQVVAADGSVIEQNDYYPFGKRWAAVAAPISDNRHRFSGKEEQAFLSLPYVDFGARMYNPDWGRWFTQDPLLEKYYPIGQYCYCAGNPISRIDLDGKDWVRGIDGNNYLWMGTHKGRLFRFHIERQANRYAKSYFGADVWNKIMKDRKKEQEYPSDGGIPFNE